MRHKRSAYSFLATGLALVSASITLIAISLWSAPAPTPSAGSVKALLPAATRNSQPLAVNDALQWNDLLQTDAKGRVRAALNDGSLISLGSNTQLRVVQHDAASQQTALDLDYGKLRNQVTKITQPQGKYQVKTANAVIGVIGTDFYVGYVKQRTTIICYEGVVSVSPLNGAEVLGSTNAAATPDGGVILHAGQIAIFGAKITQGETLQYKQLMQSSKEDTDVSGPKPQTDEEAQLVGLVNQTRNEKGLPPLTVDSRLTSAARKHTQLMMDNGDLSHRFPGEPSLTERFDQEGLPSDVEAENVGWDYNVPDAHKALADDPPHLRNMLDPRVDIIGVAVIHDGDHIWVTEDFAHLTKEKPGH